MSWPVVDRAPVQLPTLPGHDDALWATLVELSDVRPGDWTLIGGQMVFLRALEHDTVPPRMSTDLDILVNTRIGSGAVGALSADIEAFGFELDGVSPEGIAHRCWRSRELSPARAANPLLMPVAVTFGGWAVSSCRSHRHEEATCPARHGFPRLRSPACTDTC